MSHTDLVNVALFCFVALMALLLVMFLYAVIRGPRQPASLPVWTDPESPEPAQARQRATWPPGAGRQPDDIEYLPRHATPGGPPWGPAPRPPGLSQ
jgi:hypothetical protein